MSTTADSYDLIVIGAGMAGAAAAEKCATAGWRVAIVDDLPYGGTCALRGCDPKKILRRGAEIIDAAHLLTGKGIDPAGLRIDWAGLSAHMHGFTDPVPNNMENGLARHGVDTLHGTARFTGPSIRIQILLEPAGCSPPVHVITNGRTALHQGVLQY